MLGWTIASGIGGTIGAGIGVGSSTIGSGSTTIPSSVGQGVDGPLASEPLVYEVEACWLDNDAVQIEPYYPAEFAYVYDDEAVWLDEELVQIE